LKLGKAGGPDGTTGEMFKHLLPEHSAVLHGIIRDWWEAEEIPIDLATARVVHLYKKGDTQDFANYRPISLLNIGFKIFAALIHKRIAGTLDAHIQQTQYGFRKNRGTQHAIHLIRRLLEQGESTTGRLILVLLDWEKAFDKLTREGMFSALQRSGLPPKLLSLLRALYAHPLFYVEIDSAASATYEQRAGIRQGCPLSPYLFIIVMTVLFHDIKRALPRTFVQHRPRGVEFDEILYADDTVLLSSDTRMMNHFLAAVEREGANYGMFLHKHKCHALKFGPPSAVKFADGTPVTSSPQAQYLGCELNTAHDTYDEVRRRIRIAAGVLRKAHLFWRRSSATRRFKLQAVSAILYSKILHGLEGAELTGRSLQALDTFQVKCLRKVLHMDTTYVTRANTNE
jgi:hypothetical protein